MVVSFWLNKSITSEGRLFVSACSSDWNIEGKMRRSKERKKIIEYKERRQQKTNKDSEEVT